jgi:hypothetical protein
MKGERETQRLASSTSTKVGATPGRREGSVIDFNVVATWARMFVVHWLQSFAMLRNGNVKGVDASAVEQNGIAG